MSCHKSDTLILESSIVLPPHDIIRSRLAMASRAITRHYRRAALYFPGDKTVGIMDTGKTMATQPEIFTGNTVKVIWGILDVIEARIPF